RLERSIHVEVDVRRGDDEGRLRDAARRDGLPALRLRRAGQYDRARERSGRRAVQWTSMLARDVVDLHVQEPRQPAERPATQLRSSTGVCWDAVYGAPAQRNDTGQFRDKAD